MRLSLNTLSFVLASAAALALACVALPEAVIAQARLQTGGSSSNYGRRALTGGFMPDPVTVPITSGGSLDASSMSLDSDCRGFVTREPDYIVDYSAPSGFLRLYYVGTGDTTLVVYDGARWHCNDDSHGGRNPTVDISRPRAGQYDVWVGSYRPGENIRGTLHVTEMRTRHP